MPDATHSAATEVRRNTLVPLALTCVGVLLRVPYLTSKSFTLDEGFSAFMAFTDALRFLQYTFRGEMNMVLYYALLRVWVHLGTGPFMIRLLSVIAAVATIPIAYALGTRLFGRAVATVGALLFVIHPAHVALSQDARSYALTVLLVSLSSLLFLRMLERASSGNWLAYVFVSALGVYSHFFAALVLTAQWLALLLWPRPVPRRTIVKAVVLFAVLMVPLVGFLLLSSGTHAIAIGKLAPEALLRVIYWLGLSKFRLLVYVMLWAVAVLAAIRARHNPDARWPYWFLTAWLVVPVLLAIAIAPFRPLLVPRYLAVCLPAAVLLAAAGFVRLVGIARWPAAIVLALAMLFSFAALRFYYRHPEVNPDWRAATAYVVSHASRGDEVYLGGYARFTFEYYCHVARVNPPMMIAAFDMDVRPPDRIWSLYDPVTRAEVERSLPESYCPVQEHNFSGVKVALLERCKATR